MHNSRALTLCHYWVAFATFLPAVVLGAWQMLLRSPLPAPLDDPDAQEDLRDRAGDLARVGVDLEQCALGHLR